MKLLKILAPFGAGAMMLWGAAHAAFLGETVRIDYLFPDTSSLFESSGDVVVGAGIEHMFFDVQDQLTVDIDDNTITITSLVNGPISGAAFNGIRITDSLSSIDDFVGFYVISSTFNDVALSFDADNLFINLVSALSATAGQSMTLGVNFAGAPEVPLPAAAWLFMAGIGGLAAARKRQAKA